MRALSIVIFSKFLLHITLKFSIFTESKDSGVWLMRAESYFMCHGIAYENQVIFAAFHQEDYAQIWYQNIV